MYKIVVITAILSLLIINSLLGQKLKGGDTITGFPFTDVSGEEYNLEDFQHKKILLTFFNDQACSNSNFRIEELKKEYRQLKLDNFIVIAIFTSMDETLKQYKSDLNIPFIVVADSEFEVYKKFGIQKSYGKKVKSFFKKKYQKNNAEIYISADFILQGTQVLEAHYGDYIGDYLPLFRINQF